MTEAFICDYIRTPIGRFGGVLSPVRTDDLGSVPLTALMERNRHVDWQAVDDLVYGCANQAGEDNRNVARMALLLAGLPQEIPASTVNRLCGSGMDAVTIAARAIRAGEAELMIAGGVESMSRAPFVLPKAETAFSRIMSDAMATTDTALDLTPGTLTETGNKLDLGIEGEGFFVVQTPQGERFVRNGSFRLDQDRQLVDERGNAVLGDNGPIALPAGVAIEIDSTGMVKVNGSEKPSTCTVVPRPSPAVSVEASAVGAADVSAEGEGDGAGGGPPGEVPPSS